jgi:hypothetical protein
MNRITTVALVAALAGCASHQPLFEGSEAYVANGKMTVLRTPQQTALGMHWSAGSAEVAAKSQLSDDGDRRWVLEFIALQDARRTPECLHLTLSKILRDRVAPFKAAAANMKIVVFEPKKYNEVWYVDGCGRTETWRVFDDPTSPPKYDELTVLLIDGTM